MDGFQSRRIPGPFDRGGSCLLVSIGFACTAHGRGDIHNRPCRVLNQEGQNVEEETRLLCGLFEKVTEVLQGSFDGRHRLRPEASQPHSRMDGVYVLCILYFGTAEGESTLEVGMNQIILQRRITVELTRDVCIMVWFAGFSP